MPRVIYDGDLEHEGEGIRRVLGLASGLVVVLGRDDPGVLEQVQRAAGSGVQVVVTAYRARQSLCPKSCNGECDWCVVFAASNVTFVSGPDNVGEIQRALGVTVTAGRVCPTRNRQGMPPGGNPMTSGSGQSAPF